MANLRWIRLPAASVPACVADAEPRHEQESGGCNLSVTWNVAGTEALIKIDGASKPWRAGKGWIADSIGPVYDRDTRYDIFPWFYTPEWQTQGDGK